MKTLDLLTDAATKNATWYDARDPHFSEPDTSEFYVLKFMTGRYNLLIYWQEVRWVLKHHRHCRLFASTVGLRPSRRCDSPHEG